MALVSDGTGIVDRWAVAEIPEDFDTYLRINFFARIGKRDLKEAEGVLTPDYFSTAGRLAQQATEKHLKQFIQDNGDTGDFNLTFWPHITQPSYMKEW